MMKNNKGFTLIELLSVIVIIAIITSITFRVVTNEINKSKNNLYETQISNIIDASKKYMLENPNIDKYHINTICKSISVLQDNGYLDKGKIVNPKTDEDMVAKGYKFKVKFDSSTNQYVYDVTDTCIESIKIPVSEKIIKEVDIKISRKEDGLYETNDAYIYRGINPNNYIKLNNNLWRIISINKETMMVKIINLNGSQYTWQDSGIVKILNSEFDEGTTYNSIKENININSKWSKNLLSKLDSAMTIKSIEKQSNDYQTIGLLTVGEYIDASLDSECYKKNNCNSYLNNEKNYWLLNQTINGENWYINNSGNINYVKPSSEQLYYGYPVLYLKIDTEIKSGIGTREEPYILK